MGKPKDGKLCLVTGIGHCGTAWLGHILKHPGQGVFSVHEGVKGWTNRTWKEGTLHYLDHGIDSTFDHYFEEVNRLLGDFSFVVDSHSWIPTAIPEINQKTPIFQVIHLVRNGLRNVTSLYKTFSESSGEWLGEGQWFDRIIQRELKIVDGQEFDGRFPWEWWCRWWAANQKTVEWMRSSGVRVGVLRLERLTEDLDVLMRVLDSFRVVGDPVKLKIQQKIRKNPHVKEQSLEELWGGLSNEQQDTFTEICGKEMEYYGYWVDRV